MRAVIYARYSSENQREASIEDQVRDCKALIERQGWMLAATYSDHAISGSVRMRAGYQKLLEDARAGQFQVVIAEALDRLSRDQEDIAALYKSRRMVIWGSSWRATSPRSWHLQPARKCPSG